MSLWSRLSPAEKEHCFDPVSSPIAIKVKSKSKIKALNKSKVWEVKGPLQNEWRKLLPDIINVVNEDSARSRLFHGTTAPPVWELYLIGREARHDSLVPAIVTFHRDIKVAKKASALLTCLRDGNWKELLYGYELCYAEYTIQVVSISGDAMSESDDRDRDESSVNKDDQESVRSMTPSNTRTSPVTRTLCGAHAIIRSTPDLIDETASCQPTWTHATIGGALIINNMTFVLMAAHAFPHLESDGQARLGSEPQNGDSRSGVLPDFVHHATKLRNRAVFLHPVDENADYNHDLNIPTPSDQNLSRTANLLNPSLERDNETETIICHSEEDWALIPVTNNLFEFMSNTIKLPSGDLYQVRNFTEHMPEGQVFVASSVSQPSMAEFSGNPAAILLPHSKKLTMAWTLKRTSRPGDCGSWVVDAHKNVFAMVVACSTHATYCLPLAPIYKNVLETVKSPSSVSMILERLPRSNLNGVVAPHQLDEKPQSTEEPALSIIPTLDGLTYGESETTESNTSSGEDEVDAINVSSTEPPEDPRDIASLGSSAPVQYMFPPKVLTKALRTIDEQVTNHSEEIDSRSNKKLQDTNNSNLSVGGQPNSYQEVNFQETNQGVGQSSDSDTCTCLPTTLIHERVLYDLGYDFQENNEDHIFVVDGMLERDEIFEIMTHSIRYRQMDTEDALRNLHYPAGGTMSIKTLSSKAISKDTSRVESTLEDSSERRERRRTKKRENKKPKEAEKKEKTKKRTKMRKEKSLPPASGIVDDPWSTKELFGETGVLGAQETANAAEAALPPYIPPDKPIGTINPRFIPGLEPDEEVNALGDHSLDGVLPGELGADGLIDLDALLSGVKNANSKGYDELNRGSRAERKETNHNHHTTNWQNTKMTGSHEYDTGLSGAKAKAKALKPSPRLAKAQEINRRDSISEMEIDFDADFLSAPVYEDYSARNSQFASTRVSREQENYFSFDIAEHLRHRKKHEDNVPRKEPVLVGATAVTSRQNDDEDVEERFSTPPPFNLSDLSYREHTMPSHEENDDSNEKTTKSHRPQSSTRKRDVEITTFGSIPNSQHDRLEEKGKDTNPQQEHKSKIHFKESIGDEHETARQSDDRSKRTLGRNLKQYDVGKGSKQTSKQEIKFKSSDIHPEALQHYGVPYRSAEDDGLVIVEDYCTNERLAELRAYTKKLRSGGNEGHQKIWTGANLTPRPRTFDSGFFESGNERLDRALSHIPAEKIMQRPVYSRPDHKAKQASDSNRILPETQDPWNTWGRDRTEPPFGPGPSDPTPFIPLPSIDNTGKTVDTNKAHVTNTTKPDFLSQSQEVEIACEQLELEFELIISNLLWSELVPKEFCNEIIKLHSDQKKDRMNALTGLHIKRGDIQIQVESTGDPAVSSRLSTAMLDLRWEHEVMQRMWNAGYRRRLFSKVVTAHRQMEDQKRILRASGKVGSWIKRHTLPIYEAIPTKESNRNSNFNSSDWFTDGRGAARFNATDSDQNRSSRRVNRRSRPESSGRRYSSDSDELSSFDDEVYSTPAGVSSMRTEKVH